MNKPKKDILFWKRVLSNLERHKDKPYVNELIENVSKTIENIKKTQ